MASCGSYQNTSYYDMTEFMVLLQIKLAKEQYKTLQTIMEPI
jgi:hypothetical protein